MRRLAIGLLVALWCAADAGAAATASGRNWRLSIDSVGCEGALIALGAKIRYLGPKGPVESPLIRLVDEKGGQHPPKSLVWTQGSSRQIADWLAGGGLANLQFEDVGEVQLKFEMPEAGGAMNLEFGDIPGFALTRKGIKSACEGLLKPEQIHAPRPPQAARAPDAKSSLRVYRKRYPCRSRSDTLVSVDAEHPPYLPRQLLVLGRGYLPNAREIALPMGKAAAQAYAFAGAEDLKSIERVALRAAADFPEYGNARHFAFDWGLQRSASGNELYAVGLYDLRTCPGK